MGWTYGWDLKKDLIRHLTEEQTSSGTTWRTVTHCYRGGRFSGVLWSVMHRASQVAPEKSFIVCCLLHYRGGQWGYKDLEESSGPGYYSCPLSYLDMVPETNPGWRAEVRKWHAERNVKLTSGQKYVARAGLTLDRVPIHSIRVDSLKPLRGTVFDQSGSSMGQVRIKRTYCIA